MILEHGTQSQIRDSILEFYESFLTRKRFWKKEHTTVVKLEHGMGVLVYDRELTNQSYYKVTCYTILEWAAIHLTEELRRARNEESEPCLNICVDSRVHPVYTGSQV